MNDLNPHRRDALVSLASGALALAAGGAHARKEIPMRQPVAFIGHGSPMGVLDPAKAQPWIDWGARLPAARAILVISAHWEAAPVLIGATETLPLIYDFRGFPEALYAVQYAAPGAPWLADRVEALLGKGVAHRAPRRGLDHGAWTPLVHLAPAMTTPVLQISLPSEAGARAVLELGRRLAPLRDEGVLILASGNATHSFAAMGPEGSAPKAFAAEFDAWLAARLVARDVDVLVDAPTKAPGYRLNHPTAEHWLPLLAAVGAAHHSADAARFAVQGWEHGSLSRRSVQFG
jgi:4,5-DOPA dioxygenase extradiol